MDSIIIVDEQKGVRDEKDFSRFRIFCRARNQSTTMGDVLFAFVTMESAIYLFLLWHFTLTILKQWRFATGRNEVFLSLAVIEQCFKKHWKWPARPGHNHHLTLLLRRARLWAQDQAGCLHYGGGCGMQGCVEASGGRGDRYAGGHCGC